MGILHRFRLTGQVALVTGAARGLGQAMAIGLAEAGANIMILDRENTQETLDLIESMGRTCICLDCDLSDMDQERAETLIGQCIQHLGRLDILVNNAGIIRRAPALEVSMQDWQSVLDINLNCVFLLSQAAGNYFVQSGKKGKIIQMASMLSFQGGLTVPAYTAAKSAIAGLTRALANEWAGKGIQVNAIAPGYFKTEVTAGIRSDPARNQAILDRIPAGRWGDPEHLKGMVVFLASAASDYIQGAVIPVDGGWLAR
jgi:2-deoxy-D-gluconate 3-dehydrogenase